METQKGFSRYGNYKEKERPNENLYDRLWSSCRLQPLEEIAAMSGGKSKFVEMEEIRAMEKEIDADKKEEMKL